MVYITTFGYNYDTLFLANFGISLGHFLKIGQNLENFEKIKEICNFIEKIAKFGKWQIFYKLV